MWSESPHIRDYLEGLRRALPIMLGYAPVGFAFGVLAVKNNIPPALAVGMSLLMFSGSGQFVLASLWGAGAGILSVIAAVFIVNLRYLLMSAAESPWLAALPRCQRFLLGLGLTDETFVVHITALQRGWKLRLPTLYVCNSATYLSWTAGSAVGAFCGELVSDVKPLGLDYALTAMFLALLVPQCVSRLHVLVAVFTAALSIGLKGAGMSQWNVAVATVLGASLGTLLLCRQQPDEAACRLDPAPQDEAPTRPEAPDEKRFSQRPDAGTQARERRS